MLAPLPGMQWRNTSARTAPLSSSLYSTLCPEQHWLPEDDDTLDEVDELCILWCWRLRCSSATLSSIEPAVTSLQNVVTTSLSTLKQHASTAFSACSAHAFCKIPALPEGLARNQRTHARHNTIDSCGSAGSPGAPERQHQYEGARCSGRCGEWSAPIG